MSSSDNELPFGGKDPESDLSGQDSAGHVSPPDTPPAPTGDRRGSVDGKSPVGGANPEPEPAAPHPQYVGLDTPGPEEHAAKEVKAGCCSSLMNFWFNKKSGATKSGATKTTPLLADQPCGAEDELIDDKYDIHDNTNEPKTFFGCC